MSLSAPSLKSPSVAPADTPPPGGPDALRRLGASLAHHVNNALTGVVGYLELALRQAPPSGPLADHLRAARACAHQAADTVKRVIAFACHGPAAEALGPLSLRELAEQAGERLRLWAGPGVTVAVEAACPGWVQAGSHLVRTALDQLLRNALEAMPAGGRLTVTVEEKGGRNVLGVRDSGAGLSAEARQHLFEPFWTSKAGGHLGLGLALCREAVEALGGSVAVLSAEGKGTTVTLALPALAGPVRADERQSLPATPHWPQVACAAPVTPL